jgi:NTE family protein
MTKAQLRRPTVNLVGETNVDSASTRSEKLKNKFGQIVLVFQGGGALGAYQAGVYEALHEAGIEPDWLIGTSIGAINAAIIAGNKVECRLTSLREFWQRVEHSPTLESVSGLPWIGKSLPNWNTLAAGITDFFRPNPLAFLGWHVPLVADAAGYYSTAPLERTLTELVDFSLIAKSATRLTVGAAKVRTSEMRYFDSHEMPLDVRHVMASGALPPAFPPIRIDGDLGTAGFSRTRRWRRSSTTSRAATRSSSRFTSGTRMVRSRRASGR